MMSFKNSWLERLKEYDYDTQQSPGKQRSNAESLSRWPRQNDGECPSCVSPAEPQKTRMDVKNVWPFKNEAQAQGQDPDIGPVVDQLSPELKEPTDKELQPLS